ncbi:MAG: hypothetical protein EP329_07920, partial [Deltaproteobacteria bacterium]
MTKGVTQILMVGVLGVAGTWLMGCDDTGAGAAPVVVSVGQLTAAVAEEPTRVELQLRDGVVRELHASPELGHDEHLEGVVVAADRATRVLEIADVGRVEWTAAARLRTPDESRASEALWWATLEERSASGPVVVRASRPAQAGAPVVDRFVATDLRITSDDDLRSRIEVWVPASALDPAAGTITLFGRTHDLSGARLFDDHGGANEPGDDNGGAAEPGDDNGGAAEPGDDNGGAAESGDDNGGANEPGDDNGGAAEPGDDNGGANEPGDDNGGAAEPGDDNGGANEPGDDNG